MLSGYPHCESRACSMPHCTQQHTPSLPYHRQISCTLIYGSQCLVPPVMYWFYGMHFHDIEFFFIQKRERHGLVAHPLPWGRGIPRVPCVFIDHSSDDGRERDYALRDIVPLVTLYSGAKGRNWSESILNSCLNGTGPMGSRRLFGWPANSIPNIITVFLWTTLLAVWIQSTSSHSIAVKAPCNTCRRISSSSHFATGSQSISQSILSSSLPSSCGLMPWSIQAASLTIESQSALVCLCDEKLLLCAQCFCT